MLVVNMVPGGNCCLVRGCDSKPAVCITLVKLMLYYQVEPNYVGLQLLNLCQFIDDVEPMESGLKQGLNYSVSRSCVFRGCTAVTQVHIYPLSFFIHFACKSLTYLSVSYPSFSFHLCFSFPLLVSAVEMVSAII